MLAFEGNHVSGKGMTPHLEKRAVYAFTVARRDPRQGSLGAATQ